MALTQAKLKKLLIDAEKAHATYQKKLGRTHKDWPGWYARYMLKKLKSS